MTAQQGGRPRVPGVSEVSSTRIGDLNGRPSRNVGGSGEKPKISKAFIIVIVLVALLAVGGVSFMVLRYTNAFPVKNLSVNGVEHLTNAEVSELAAVPEGSSLLDVDTDAIANRLKQDTWVESVTVSRAFPDTLVISVKERTVDAVVEILAKDSGSSKLWAIASDGMWLMPIPDRDSTAGQATSEKVYEDADAALHIEGVPYTAQAEMGKQCTDSNVNNALGIVRGMTTELAGQVKTVVASDPDSTTLILDNGIEIAFGSSDDIRTKERVCLQLMKEHEGEIAYINVRTVDSPTWRSTK